MQAREVQRKLAAILAADVEGYSRLMGADEVGTLRSLNAHRAVMDGIIAAHRGRIFNSAGDSIAAEFPSVIDAVQCAVEVQRALDAENAAVPLQKQMRFRIGIHVGDVLVEDGNLFGDGVNVAARLEALAEPGGICVSAAVREHVGNRLPLTFDDLGEQRVKNIAAPIRAYRILGVAGARSEAARLTPPSEPSIVVLPFANLSGNPSQDYLAEGITEELTTALSRLRWLFVIARNSAYAFQGRAIDVRQIARELGVRYVLEGSVRTTAKHVRIAAQLIDAASGTHIWAERYDGELASLFDVQDEITEKVVASIEPHIYAAEGFRAVGKPPENLDAWALVVRAFSLICKVGREQNAEAQRLARAAIALDPTYARAHSVLGWARLWAGHCFWVPDAEVAYREAATHAETAIALDPSEPWAHVTLGHALSGSGLHAQAIQELQTAIELSPSFALAHTIHGWVLLRAGRFEEAIAATGKALRMSPKDSFAGLYTSIHGLAYLAAGRFAEALPFLRQSIAAFPEFSGNYRTLASCCGHLGLLDEARFALERAERVNPGFGIGRARQHLRRFAHRDIYCEGLRKAGAPE